MKSKTITFSDLESEIRKHNNGLVEMYNSDEDLSVIDQIDLIVSGEYWD